MGIKWYGWIGLWLIVAVEMLLFRDVRWVGIWFTPIVWTGYILFVDSLVLRLKGCSLIYSRRREFLMMSWLSIFFWLIFEVYNLFLMNWYYIHLPAQAWQRTLGYGWAFATIFPAILETDELLEALLPFENLSMAKSRLSKRQLYLSIIVGLTFVTIPPLLPFIYSRYLFGFVWLGYIFFLDPINYLLGGPSLYRDWAEGRPGQILSLLLAGLICGLLWEFWNYWAYTKWIYAVPILSDIKLFEMPVLGFLGFPPFALECYVLYNFAKRVLKGEVWASQTRI